MRAVIVLALAAICFGQLLHPFGPARASGADNRAALVASGS
jgi:hypothetical protein